MGVQQGQLLLEWVLSRGWVRIPDIKFHSFVERVLFGVRVRRRRSRFLFVVRQMSWFPGLCRLIHYANVQIERVYGLAVDLGLGGRRNSCSKRLSKLDPIQQRMVRNDQP